MSTNLGAQQLSGGMANPETAVNSATGRLDAAITEIRTVDLTNDAVLTTAQYQAAYRFDLTPVASGKKVTVPAVKRAAIFNNAGANDAIIQVGTTQVTLAAGYAAMFYTDGTANGIVKVLLRSAPVHFYTGTTVPSTVAGAIDGDFYIRSTNGLLYQMVSGIWTNTGVNVGASSGAANAPHWYSGAGAPGTVTGSVDGDYYYNTTNGDLYQKGLVTSGVWAATGVTLGTGGGGGGGSSDIRPPTTTLFNTTFNGTGVTQSATYNSSRGLVMTRTDSLSSGDHGAFLGKTVPSGSWEAVMKIETGPIKNDFQRWGLAIINSATKDTVMVGPDWGGGSPSARTVRFNALDTFTSALGTNIPASGNLSTGSPMPKWFKIGWDGTTYTFYISTDDQISWTSVYTVTAASLGFTATHVGMCMQHFNGCIENWKTICRYYSDPDFP